MRKYAVTLLATTLMLALTAIIYIHFYRNNTFICQSQYDLTEDINGNTLRSQGLLSAQFSNNHFLISLEGLFNSNGDKYIVSRSIAMTLKRTTAASPLFYITDLKITRHNADNTPDNIAHQHLFGKQTNDNIIYINHVHDEIILFGNHTFPQYGCQRQKKTIN